MSLRPPSRVGDGGTVQLLGLENTVNCEEETNNGIVTMKLEN